MTPSGRAESGRGGHARRWQISRQQAVEKALKVALVLADVDFPRSHDLRELVDIPTDNDVPVPGSIEEARWLTPWAAQLRYEMLEPPDRDAAFSTASDAVAWATALLVG
ncbi:MAG TPA: HEPN domain-containing protein [Solirubrobacteraceae bacterium]